jgi:putative methionine-R-sulfoxide reductase with GAF domain
VPEFCTPDPVALIQAIREVELKIAGIPPSEPFHLYQTLHEAAGRMLPVDAFYVCLYAAREQRLFFPYNFDGQLYDGPVNIPLGQGPTSWVIRNRKPFVLEYDNRSVQDGGVSFGDSERCSQSAIHVPIMRKSGDAPYGVLSAQSYAPSVYGEFAVAYLQWLAERAEAAMDRAHDGSEIRSQLAAAEDLAADR